MEIRKGRNKEGKMERKKEGKMERRKGRWK